MAIPNYIFDQLNSQADLVSIIGRHTTLKKAGNEYKGCCPFHGEKTPSFYVNPSKGMYHCFGCGVGGNALKFLQEYENLTFMEALKELSQQTGIEIPEDDDHKVKYKRYSTQQPSIHSPIQTQKQQINQGYSQEASKIDTKLLPETSVVTFNKDISADTIIGQTFSDDDVFDNTSIEESYADFHNYQDTHSSYFSNTSDDPRFLNSSEKTQNVLHGLEESTLFINHQDEQPLSSEGNLYDLLEQIHAFYQDCLLKTPNAYTYFQDRGLTDTTITTFGLGYAPKGWQHLEEKFPNDIEGLKLLGLVRTSESGRDYDLLRDRVIFVIRDSQGRVIGFAGRALDNTVKPKYINSSESPVFHKQNVLYGYYESRQHRANDWLVVEGYMDVIALYQAGIYGAVASMGTATNQAQISRLLTLNPILTLSFDGDAAGQKAAWRTLEVSLPVLTDDKELRFLTLPDNHDPDTYIAENGSAAMKEHIQKAIPLSQYVYDYLSTQHDLNNPEGKAKLMSDVKNLTHQLPKGSTFRSLLNNYIYQRLSGRQESNHKAQDILLNFRTQFTSSINLCLCLLYQPTLLADNPIEYIYQQSGIQQLTLPKSIDHKIAGGLVSIPPLPTWKDLQTQDDISLVELVQNIQSLLHRLPKDANTASHFILASLSPSLQSSLSPHWQSFYTNMREREIENLTDFFIELLLQELLKTIGKQQKQADSLIIRDILLRRRQTLIAWEKLIQQKR